MAVQPFKVLSERVDSLRFVTEDFFETMQPIPTKIDSLQSAVQQLAGGQAIHQTQMDTIVTKLNAIKEYGVGFSDVSSYIAIPLIIALFAFAFTYLFSVITRINEKYESEHISKMFKTCAAYRCYMWGSRISVGYIIVMGILSLSMKGNGHHNLMLFLNWSCLTVAGIYAGIILWFVRTCLLYDDHLKMMDLIEERYRKDITMWSVLERIEDICRYAIRNRNEGLLVTVLRRVNEISKTKKDRNDSQSDLTTSNFYWHIVKGLIQYPCAREMEDNLIWSWSQAFRRDKLPTEYDVSGMLGIMVEAVKQGRFRLYEAYVEKIQYSLPFIKRIARVSYISGKSVKEQVDVENQQIEIWRELREMHYLVAAYLFSIGHYEIAGVMKKGAGYHDDTLFPATIPQIMKLYSACKEKQDTESGSFDQYCFTDTVIGHRYDRDILEKYTAIMLMMAEQTENDELLIIDERKLDILLAAKTDLDKFGLLWKKHSVLTSLYPVIQDKEIKTIIKEGLNHLSIGDLQKEKRKLKPLCLKKSGLFETGKTEQSQENLFDLKIEKEKEDLIRRLFNNLLVGNIFSITEGVNSDNNEDKHDAITMSAFSFLTNKENVFNTSLWQNHYMFNEMERVFRSRYVWMVYDALSKMKIKDVTVKKDRFEKKFLKFVRNEGEKFVIIDTESLMQWQVSFDKPKDGLRWPFRRFYKNAYYFDAGKAFSFPLKEVPLVESFYGTVSIVRLTDMPSLVPSTEDGFPMVSFKDESDKEKGWAAVRITVDPCYVARFNKDAEVLRVKLEW